MHECADCLFDFKTKKRHTCHYGKPVNGVSAKLHLKRNGYCAVKNKVDKDEYWVNFRKLYKQNQFLYALFNEEFRRFGYDF